MAAGPIREAPGVPLGASSHFDVRTVTAPTDQPAQSRKPGKARDQKNQNNATQRESGIAIKNPRRKQRSMPGAARLPPPHSGGRAMSLRWSRGRRMVLELGNRRESLAARSEGSVSGCGGYAQRGRDLGSVTPGQNPNRIRLAAATVISPSCGGGSARRLPNVPPRPESPARKQAGLVSRVRKVLLQRASIPRLAQARGMSR